MADVAHQLSLQVRHGSEHAASDDVSLNLGEPQLYLIEPRGVGRREVQANFWVRIQEIFDQRTLVRRQIVGDDSDLFATRLVGNDIAEESDELGRRMPRRGLAEHLARLGVEGRVQGQRAVAKILKAVSLGAPWGKRQHRILAIEGLNRRLFVDAEHGRVLRRMQIKADDLRRFALKIRIIRGHVALEPVGPQGVLAPDPCHHHVRDPQLLGKLAGTPVRRSVGWLALDAPLQDASFNGGGESRGQLAGVPAEQPRQTLSQEALTPTINKAVRAVELVADYRPRLSTVQEQNQARTSRLIGPAGLTRGSLCEFHFFHFRQDNRVAHEHQYTRFSVVTGH